MPTIVSSLVALAVVALTAIPTHAGGERPRLALAGQWLFRADPQDRGVGWYRKKFEVPADGSDENMRAAGRSRS